MSETRAHDMIVGILRETEGLGDVELAGLLAYLDSMRLAHIGENLSVPQSEPIASEEA